MVTAFRTNLLCATALSIACALAVPAHAQDAASQGEKPEAQEGGLETIVVTAQKREQNLQDVPAAVSAIGGETLRTRGITETSDLMGAIPSLQVNVFGYDYLNRGMPRTYGVEATVKF